MYEAHFGLKSNPFGAKTDGPGVFVGPAQNKVINALHKALKTQDAVVTVTGPVGVGKTTIVTRALQAMSPGRTAAWVGRMQLGANDLTELLLAGFGIASKSKGPVRRFAAFRRLTQIQAENGAPVAIIVEDTHRIGIDALDELEALTSADSGDTDGSNIILMGQPGLNERLKTPELARLRQRMRLRQEIDALSTAEVQGYLKHAVRQAGGDFDQLFENGAIDIVAQATDGIPRMINSLCSAAMSAAMDTGKKQVSRALLAQVARETFGFDFKETQATSDVATAPSKEAAPAPVSAKHSAAAKAAPAAGKATARKQAAKSSPMDALPPAARNVVVESGRYPETDNAVESAPDGATPVAADPVDAEIPELINDTQPQLEQLDVAAISGSKSVAADAESPDKSPAGNASPSKTGAVDPAPPDGSPAEKPAATTVADAGDESTSGLARPAPADNGAESLPTPVATKAKAADSNNPGPAPDDDAKDIADELPTLSESMRVHALPEAEAGEAPPASAVVADTEASDAGPEGIAVFDPTETLADALETAQQETAHLQELEAAALDSVAELEPDAMPELEAAAIPELDTATSAAPSLPEPDAPVANDEAPAEAQPEAAAKTPAITLDDALDQRAPATPATEDREKLERFAEEIGNANSLEDISELMAETLFGNQDLDQIAAEIAAEKPAAAPPTPAPGESPVKLDAEPAQAAEKPNSESPDVAAEKSDVPPALQQPKIDPVATGEIALTLELEQSGVHPATNNAEAVDAGPEPAAAAPAPAANAPSPAAPEPAAHNLRDSVAMRIEMLNKMNAAAKPATKPPAKPTAAPQPETIEEQITTSMTQTLEALKVSKKAAPTPPDDDDDKVEQKKSGGLFSRFRRSS